MSSGPARPLALAGRLALALIVQGCGQGTPEGRDVPRTPMREMMQQMMAGVVPSGVLPEDLPDPQSQGAALLTAYCTQCHALPSPSMHAAVEWPAVVARMAERMSMMARIEGMMMGGIQALRPDQEGMLLHYLEAHALREAPPATVESRAPGAPTFARACFQCHALPDPALHTPAEWPSIVERMQWNHRQMGKPLMADQEIETIVGFLREHATGTGGP